MGGTEGINVPEAHTGTNMSITVSRLFLVLLTTWLLV